jgi:hypothetical protein
MAFNLADYQTVQERIEIFRNLYPTGRIVNEIVLVNEQQIIIKSAIWLDSEAIHPVAVDFAQETIGSSNINKTSFVENCATSATGRAISLLGGTMSPKGKRPSRTEMEKVKRAERDYVAEAGTITDLEALRKLYADALQAKADQMALDYILQRSEDLKK